MKEYDKFIFDLDYTILIPDWSKEDDYLQAHIPKEQQEEFFQKKQDILNEFELTHPKYDLKALSDFFGEFNLDVSEEVIRGWMLHNGETIIDEVPDGVIDLFKYLKATGKKIVILTSWFGATQVPRLKRAGLSEYIDQMVAGDDAMKPSPESFALAIGDTPKEKCLMVGDSIKSDKMGAERVGIDCYIVGNGQSIRDLYNKIVSPKLNDKAEKAL